jgi:hypothetical protein
MSFQTDLIFYRPTEPPLVNGAALAAFVRAFAGLGVVGEGARFNVHVKFGERIDQDDRPFTWEEPINEVISTYGEIDWDIDESPETLEAAATLLEGETRPFYRGFLSLGEATDEVSSALERSGSPENDIDLSLSAWFLTICPVTIFNLGTETPFLVGWISMNLSGNGYLYPWTFAELLARAESSLAIGRVVELCRATWPVPRVNPDLAMQRLRSQMGDLWPYSDVGRPWDWYWGLAESG